MCTSLKAFLSTDEISSEEEKVIAVEVTKTYHSVKHSLSYKALDCETTLDRNLYTDSNTATKIKLGRTKASAIAFNVLGPASIQEAVEELQNNLFYSITDSSNHNATKIFPLFVKFYTPKTNLKHACWTFTKTQMKLHPPFTKI